MSYIDMMASLELPVAEYDKEWQRAWLTRLGSTVMYHVIVYILEHRLTGHSQEGQAQRHRIQFLSDSLAIAFDVGLLRIPG
jgi:hypothetical protein